MYAILLFLWSTYSSPYETTLKPYVT
jgi:hypothetical protein